jgi:hypothetical protein
MLTTLGAAFLTIGARLDGRGLVRSKGFVSTLKAGVPAKHGKGIIIAAMDAFTRILTDFKIPFCIL